MRSLVRGAPPAMRCLSSGYLFSRSFQWTRPWSKLGDLFPGRHEQDQPAVVAGREVHPERVADPPLEQLLPLRAVGGVGVVDVHEDEAPAVLVAAVGRGDPEGLGHRRAAPVRPDQQLGVDRAGVALAVLPGDGRDPAALPLHAGELRRLPHLGAGLAGRLDEDVVEDGPAGAHAEVEAVDRGVVPADVDAAVVHQHVGVRRRAGGQQRLEGPEGAQLGHAGREDHVRRQRVGRERPGVEHDDLAAPPGELGRRRRSGHPGSHHHDIGFFTDSGRHATPPRQLRALRSKLPGRGPDAHPPGRSNSRGVPPPPRANGWRTLGEPWGSTTTSGCGSRSPTSTACSSCR